MKNKKFGKLLVLERAGSDKQRRALWKCQCDCGNITIVRGTYLRSGHTISCGCERILSKGYKITPMIGRKFGKLTVLSRVEDYISPQGQKQPKYRCKCDCGNIINVVAQSLRNNATQSCGCIVTSIGENNIQKILIDNKIDFVKEYKFPDLGLLRYDFYLPNYNRLIEFDGRQHNDPSPLWDDKESFEIRKHRDQLKNDYAKNHNIDLVRIPYTKRDSITLELLLGDKYLLR